MGILHGSLNNESLKAVWPDLFGCIFEVWPAPGAQESPQEGGGLRPPHFARLSGAPGAGRTSKTHPKNRPDCRQVPRNNDSGTGGIMPRPIPGSQAEP